MFFEKKKMNFFLDFHRNKIAFEIIIEKYLASMEVYFISFMHPLRVQQFIDSICLTTLLPTVAPQIQNKMSSTT